MPEGGQLCSTVATDFKQGESMSVIHKTSASGTDHSVHKCVQVFEGGSLYSTAALDIKQDDLMSAVQSAIANVAAVSLQLNHPTLASIPHSLVNGYKNVLAVSVATEYTFPLAEKVCLPAVCITRYACTAAHTSMC